MPVNPLLDSLNDTQNEAVKGAEKLLVCAIGTSLEEKDGPVKAMITDSGSFCIYNTDVSPEISAPPIPAEYTPGQLNTELWRCGLFNFVTMPNSKEPSTLINQLISDLKKLPDNTLLLSVVRKPLDQNRVNKLFDESVYTSTIEESYDLNVDESNEDAHSIVNHLRRLGLRINNTYASGIKNIATKHVISVEKTADQKLEEFVRIFPELCAKYQIPLLHKKTTYATRTVIPGDPPDIVYEFNVSPENLHAMLMHESLWYAGYHHEGSVLRLNEPNKILLKKDTLCLFPVHSLTDNTVILRNAGCQVRDVIATQLSFFVKEYVDPSLPTSHCYGHGDTAICQMFAINIHDLVQVALNCAQITQPVSTQGEEGITELTLSVEARAHLKNMTPEAHAIYSRLAAVPSDELNELQSIEIPITDFFTALANKLINEIKEKQRIVETSPQASQIEHEQRMLKLTRALSTIHTVIQNVLVPQEELNQANKKTVIQRYKQAIVSINKNSDSSVDETIKAVRPLDNRGE